MFILRSPSRIMQFTQDLLAPAAMAAGAAMVVAPVIVAGPALAVAGFGAGGIAAGSAAAGVHSGIGSVVAGSAFATLQSAGAGGVGLAVVNGVVQAAGVVNDQQKGVASLSPEDDNKPNGEGEGEVPQSRVDNELKRFRQLKDDFFRPVPVVKKEPKAPRQRRKFTRLCPEFRNDGDCEQGESCKLFHFVPWELPGKQFTDYPVDLFFANFKEFDYQRTKPFFDEFYRMCDHFGWSDEEATEPWYNFRVSLIQEFNYVVGEDKDNLLHWQNMFNLIGLPKPTSLHEARTTMRVTHVNLVDLVESPRTRQPVEHFKTVQDLSQYSVYEVKIFPKEEAYNGGLLALLLREILGARSGRARRARK
ncbi:Interferon alpha-inducible protein IFI6/IFI27-like [Fusarium oxysporum f. sp. vasinfectum]|nr:Interferon alpha-inducible protein IFI6/IFI27-like [Fusarium oxysporum f. sp. vasinfectum]